jgi:nicotinate-nucleotide adenylyltransferase
LSRIFAGLPPYAAGQRIGLYGGSFNPAHEGHRHVSLQALRRLRLDQVWWLVTPGNPLKDVSGLTSLDRRMAMAAEVAAHPKIAVSGAELCFRTRYTADLIAILKARAPQVRFVWIMGSDNLAQLHRWDRWRTIAGAVPIAVVNRPGYLARALAAPAAQALQPYRIDEADAATLAGRHAPAWLFLTGPRTAVSSTALRSGNGISTASV